MRARDVRSAATFTVYDEGRGLLASMSDGRDLVSLIDVDDLEDRGRAMVRIERHVAAEGYHAPRIIDAGELHAPMVRREGRSILGGGRWRSRAFDVYVLDESTGIPDPSDSTYFDALLVHRLTHMSGRDMDAVIPLARHVVLCGGLSWKVRGAMMDACLAAGIPVHDVRSQGAFVLRR